MEEQIAQRREIWKKRQTEGMPGQFGKKTRYPLQGEKLRCVPCVIK